MSGMGGRIRPFRPSFRAKNGPIWRVDSSVIVHYWRQLERTSLLIFADGC